eukprot:363466-Chlamydomonas_euryale.AAC.3
MNCMRLATLDTRRYAAPRGATRHAGVSLKQAKAIKGWAFYNYTSKWDGANASSSRGHKQGPKCAPCRWNTPCGRNSETRIPVLPMRTSPHNRLSNQLHNSWLHSHTFIRRFSVTSHSSCELARHLGYNTKALWRSTLCTAQRISRLPSCTVLFIPHRSGVKNTYRKCGHFCHRITICQEKSL